MTKRQGDVDATWYELFMSASLRDELLHVAGRRDLDTLDRSMMVVAVVTEALQHLAVEPVLVGGMAVLFWTQIDEFATADIDLVMDEPRAVDEVLRGLGFSLATDGRHWNIPGSEIFIEVPDRKLEPEGATVEIVHLGDGRQARVLSQVDVLLGRVLELTLAPHPDVALQALSLIPSIADRDFLMRRAREVDAQEKVTNVTRILERLMPVADGVSAGRRTMPDHDEMYVLVAGA